MLMRAYAVEPMGEARLVDESQTSQALFWPRNALQEQADPRTADDFELLGITAPQHGWPMQEASIAGFAFDTLGGLHLESGTATAGDAPIAAQPAVGLWWGGSMVGRKAWEMRHERSWLNSNDTEIFETYNPWSIFVRWRFAAPTTSTVILCGNRSSTGNNEGWELRVVVGGDLVIVVDDSVAGMQSSTMSMGAATADDRAWHYALVCYDGNGDFNITSDLGTIASTSFTVDSAAPGEEFAFGSGHVASTAVALQYSGAYAWRSDRRTEASAIASALWRHGAYPTIGVAGESIIVNTGWARAYHAGIDDTFGEYVATYGSGQFAVYYDIKANPESEEAYGCIFDASRQNLATNSEDFSGWTTSGGSFSAVGTTAPSGHIIAQFFAGNNAEYIESPSAIVASATDYCHSIWLRNVVADHGAAIEFVSGAGAVLSSKPIAVTTAWQRFFITDTTTDTGARLRLVCSDDGTSQGVEFWGYQLEVGTVPTQYIATFGAAVGIGSERLRFTHDAGAISTLRGTIEAQVTLFADDDTATRTLVDLDDGNLSLENRLVMHATSGLKGFSLLLYDATESLIGTQVPGGSGVAFSAGARVRAAWDSDADLPQHAPNNFAILHEGEPADVENSTVNATGVVVDANTQMSPGATAGGANRLKGMIRRLEVFGVPHDLGG